MGNLVETVYWATKGDKLTFLEAYKSTGKILNITINSTVGDRPSLLLNCKTTPTVTIASAVLASSALPGLLPTAKLMEKDEKGNLIEFVGVGKEGWRDGSFKTDIPKKSLHWYFKVHFTIVSQVNPHVIMFFYNQSGSVGQPSLHLMGKGWRGGFFFTILEHLLKLEMLKWMRLVRNLQLTPTLFGQDLSKVFLQTFHGNITIHPDISIADWLFLVSTPTPQQFQQKISTGVALTLPKVSMIKNRLSIEKKLESSYLLFKTNKSEA